MLARKMKMVVAAIFFGAGAMVGGATAANAQDAAQSNISKATVPAGSGASVAADASPKKSAAPESSSADTPAWKEYKKLLDNYYFLDKQKAGHISCSVSASFLQDYIDNLRQTSGNQLTIDENLHAFSMTYDRIKGFSFNPPHLNISLSPDIKVANPEQIEATIKEKKEEFNVDLHIVEDSITGFLKEMTFPDPKMQKNLLLTRNGDTTTVSYDEDENNHNKVEYSGTMQKISESTPTANATGTSDYLPLNGKLALAHQVSELTFNSKKSNFILSMSYQNLGPSFFPAQILVDMTKSDSKQLHFEVNFKDCKTSDLSP